MKENSKLDVCFRVYFACSCLLMHLQSLFSSFVLGGGVGSVQYWPIVVSSKMWQNSMCLLLLMNFSLINSKLSHATPNQYPIYVV